MRDWRFADSEPARRRPGPQRTAKLTLLSTLLVAAALAASTSATAYPWPIKPFNKPHPVRGNFGDPRTYFSWLATTDGLNGPGNFTFHNGIDISAPAGTPVYPVVSGIAHVLSVGAVGVTTPGGRSFQYQHIEPLVFDGDAVKAGVTVLGRVNNVAGHVHLSELAGGRAVNPLLRGHIAPYRDRTKPVVRSVEFRASTGVLNPLGLAGTVSIVADAFDRPAMNPPLPWRGLPVAPALVGWSMISLTGRPIVTNSIAANFLAGIPLNSDFWSVYARGTYQNMPRFATQYFAGMPGRYLFMLAPAFDTHLLPNGVYQLTVSAVDTRGNTGQLTTRVTILNPVKG
jgi:murein DD-endopeptidase MepM/ murein hydrolase activator NlpD